MRRGALLMLACLAPAAEAADDDWYAFFQAERFEYQHDNDAGVWEMQGWVGGDYRKFWWKTEGEFVDGGIADGELQALYSRAWSAYFDLQFGMRYEDLDGTSRFSAVGSVHGMAPYRFETDLAAFVTEDGDLLLRGEFERDLLVTQRLILQPRAELNLSFSDIPELETASGLTDVDLELRLRYELSRKFAPYIGLSWQKLVGSTADLARARGDRTETTTWVAGLRFWF